MDYLPFSQKLLQTKTGKKKQKSSNELLNGHAKKKAKKSDDVIDDNEEILSDSDLDDEQDGEPVNGNVRLDSLLFNEDDDENNVHEQRLKRAKEYIEQIAKQGKAPRLSL